MGPGGPGASSAPLLAASAVRRNRDRKRGRRDSAMRQYRSYLVLAAVALALGFLLLVRDGWPSGARDVGRRLSVGRSARLDRADSRRELVEALRIDPQSAPELAQRPLPRSLQGTEIAGGLGADADGHLILGRGILELFDYFLSAVGEEPLSVIRARIVAEIDKRLPPTAAREAIALLDKYFEYRERARLLYAEDRFSDDLSTRLEQLRTLRREVFGEDIAEVLFGEEEARDYVALAQREVMRDQSLSEEERWRKWEELERQLPEPVRKAREETMKPVRFFREQEKLREAGASPSEIRALRERYWGPEAADRLEALDREEAEWRRRVDDYRAARTAIENDASLRPEEKVHKIEELVAARFTARERIRVDALDRIEQQR